MMSFPRHVPIFNNPARSRVAAGEQPTMGNNGAIDRIKLAPLPYCLFHPHRPQLGLMKLSTNLIYEVWACWSKAFNIG